MGMRFKSKAKPTKRNAAVVKEVVEVPLCEQPLSETEEMLLELVGTRDEVCIITSGERAAAKKLKKRRLAGLYQNTLTGLWWLVPPCSS